jgi:hypothetical protein
MRSAYGVSSLGQNFLKGDQLLCEHADVMLWIAEIVAKIFPKLHESLGRIREPLTIIEMTSLALDR